MGDSDKIMAECVSAQSDQREISDACARVIASQHHSGQASLGYSFASTGAIPEDEGASGLWRDLFPTYIALTDDDQLAANMLGTYLINQGPRGPVDGWSGLWL